MVQAFNDAKEKAWSGTFNLTTLNVSSLAGVEVYKSGTSAPGIFTGESGCGVLVLWTRR